MTAMDIRNLENHLGVASGYRSFGGYWQVVGVYVVSIWQVLVPVTGYFFQICHTSQVYITNIFT